MPRYVLAAFVVYGAASASAQSVSDPQSHFQNEARRRQCALTQFQVIHQCALLLEPRFVSIVLVGVEGCGGGSNHGNSIQAFVSEGGRPRSLPVSIGRSHPDSIGRVRMQDSKIIVEGLSHGPDDARCCPTLRRLQDYTVMDGRVSPSVVR